MTRGTSTQEWDFKHPYISDLIDITIVEPPTPYEVYVGELLSINNCMIENNLTYPEFTEQVTTILRTIEQKQDKSPQDIRDICLAEGVLLRLDIMYA